MPHPDHAPDEPTPATDSGGFLTRDAILAAQDIRYDEVPVPEWGGPGAKVRIRSMTGRERDAYDAETWRMSNGGKDVAGGMTDFRVRRVARAIIGADGLPLFDEKDIRVFGEKNGEVIDRIDDAVVALSGMGAKAAEKAVADLKAVPSEGSGTA